MNIGTETPNTKKVHLRSHKRDRNLYHPKECIRRFAKRRVSCGVGADQSRFERQAPVVGIGRYAVENPLCYAPCRRVGETFVDALLLALPLARVCREPARARAENAIDKQPNVRVTAPRSPASLGRGSPLARCCASNSPQHFATPNTRKHSIRNAVDWRFTVPRILNVDWTQVTLRSETWGSAQDSVAVDDGDAEPCHSGPGWRRGARTERRMRSVRCAGHELLRRPSYPGCPSKDGLR